MEIAIDYDTPAKLMKWPSLNGERVSARDGAVLYTVFHGTLAECIQQLQEKVASQHHLYEIHTGDGTVLSATDAIASLERLGASAHPPPEEDLGGGDIVSPRQESSTDDDQPLD
jgi:hypothetical protein